MYHLEKDKVGSNFVLSSFPVKCSDEEKKSSEKNMGKFPYKLGMEKILLIMTRIPEAT